MQNPKVIICSVGTEGEVLAMFYGLGQSRCAMGVEHGLVDDAQFVDDDLAGLGSGIEVQWVEVYQPACASEIKVTIGITAVFIAVELVARQAIALIENTDMASAWVEKAKPLIGAYPKIAVRIALNGVDDIVRKTLFGGVCLNLPDRTSNLSSPEPSVPTHSTLGSVGSGHTERSMSAAIEVVSSDRCA
jgi:hypothetical protein